MEKSVPRSLYDVTLRSTDYQIQRGDQSYEAVSNSELQRDTSALGLLALNYGNASDSEEDQSEPDFPTSADESKSINCFSESMHHCDNSGLPPVQDCPRNATGVFSLSGNGGVEETLSSHIFDCYAQHGRRGANLNDGSQTSDHSVEFKINDLTSIKPNGFVGTSSDPMTIWHNNSDRCPHVHDAEKMKFGKAVAPIEKANMSLSPRSDEDSSRMHVFCLEHAVEVEQQLRPIGGVHILLLCHPGACFYNSSFITCIEMCP